MPLVVVVVVFSSNFAQGESAWTKGSYASDIHCWAQQGTLFGIRCPNKPT